MVWVFWLQIFFFSRTHFEPLQRAVHGLWEASEALTSLTLLLPVTPPPTVTLDKRRMMLEFTIKWMSCTGNWPSLHLIFVSVPVREVLCSLCYDETKKDSEYFLSCPCCQDNGSVGSEHWDVWLQGMGLWTPVLVSLSPSLSFFLLSPLLPTAFLFSPPVIFSSPLSCIQEIFQLRQCIWISWCRQITLLCSLGDAGMKMTH